MRAKRSSILSRRLSVTHVVSFLALRCTSCVHFPAAAAAGAQSQPQLAFVSQRRQKIRSLSSSSIHRQYNDVMKSKPSALRLLDDDKDEWGGESSDDNLQDWRSFQARLIAQEEVECQSSAESSSKDVINESSVQQISSSDVMPGTLLISTLPDPKSDEEGYGLGRQYLHKAVILVLDRTQYGISGVILNRGPMFELGLMDIEGKMLEHSEEGWTTCFGGDSFRIDEETEEEDDSTSGASCLFFKSFDPESESCREIVDGVYFTTHWTARNAYVHEGLAAPEDFWLFYGHMHWSTKDFELEEETWNCIEIVSNPSKILSTIRSLAIEENAYGMQVWSLLNNAIKQKVPEASSFDDDMLREWSLTNLPLTRARHPEAEEFEEEYSPGRAGGTYDIKVGTILRGSSASHLPFLLADQEYINSLMLVIQNDDNFSVGVLLNLPSAKTVDLQVAGNPDAFFKGPVSVGSIPVRYGGPFDFVGTSDQPLLFLHKSKAMKDADLGEPLGFSSSSYNIWRCGLEEAVEAVTTGKASPTELMSVNGFCVWEGGGLRQEIVRGHYEKVPLANTEKIWNILSTQRLLSNESIDDNLRIAQEAWLEAGKGKKSTHRALKGQRKSLADAALYHWVRGFLLKISANKS